MRHARQVRAAGDGSVQEREEVTHEEDPREEAPVRAHRRRPSTAFRDGRMIIVVDDEDRENEGDLTVAAEKVTPDVINFMAKYGRGQICLSMTRRAPRRARRAAGGQRQHDAVRHRLLRADRRQVHVTTGISAADRAATILAAIDPKTRPSDLARPGPRVAAAGAGPAACSCAPARPRLPSISRGSRGSIRPASSAKS